MAPLEPGRAGELAAALKEANALGRPAPVVAAAAAITLKPGAEPLALHCADAALAKSLGWRIAVPLLAGEVLSRHASGERRRPKPGEPGGPKAAALAYADAAIDAAPKLRAKGKGRARSRFCSATTRSRPRRPCPD
jgi:hypothetical protein